MVPVPKTALVVGNGFTLSLRGHVGSRLEAWDPSDPFGWVDASGVRALDRFPALSAAIEQTDPNRSAFERIAQVAAWASVAPNRVATELRHFLALAYSIFDAHVGQIPTGLWLLWPWCRYLAGIRIGLEFIVSFNYDRVIERALDAAGIPFRRVGISTERAGVPILKPHGSIDFDAAITGLTAAWPIKTVGNLVDTPLVRLEQGDRLGPRVHAELVPPEEASKIASFQWVKPGFDLFRARAKTLEQCIIIGHRHAPVDQPEVLWLLGCLKPGTRLVVANTECSPDLREFARERGLTLAWWQPGPNLNEVRGQIVNLGALRRRRSTPSRPDVPATASKPHPGPAAIQVTGADPSAPPPPVYIGRSTFRGAGRLLDVHPETEVFLNEVRIQR